MTGSGRLTEKPHEGVRGNHRSEEVVDTLQRWCELLGEFEALALRTDEANRNWRLMDHKSDASSASQAPAYEATKQTLIFIVLIFVLHSTKIYGPWDHAKNMYREDAQPLLLVGAEA